MATYDLDRVMLYLERIQARSERPYIPTCNELFLRDYLRELWLHHVTHIPVHNLRLHYSASPHAVSLEANDLFRKIVLQQRGGSALELNTLFANLLRSLGFIVRSTGTRRGRATYSGMVNIVIFPAPAARYLVDVGCGTLYSEPQPLLDDWVFQNINGDWSRLNQFLDPHFRSCEWTVKYYTLDAITGMERAHELYSFAEVEFLPEDFRMISAIEARPDFVPNHGQVFVARAILHPAGAITDKKWVSLRNHEILLCAIRPGGTSARFRQVEVLSTEEDRERALLKHFNIQLTDSEKQAIVGRPTELQDMRSGSLQNGSGASGSSSLVPSIETDLEEQ